MLLSEEKVPVDAPGGITLGILILPWVSTVGLAQVGAQHLDREAKLEQVSTEPLLGFEGLFCSLVQLA